MVGIRAFVFKGKKSAQKALDTIENNPVGYAFIDDVAVISVTKNGDVKVHSTWAQDDDDVSGGIGWGAITGGLIGALLGPGGALLGALGGAATGGLIGTTVALNMEDPKLTDLAMSLKNDTSALVLVSEEPTLLEFTTSMESFDAEVIETNMNEQDVIELREKLKS
jgi:uncharacterized membrane protein